MKLTKCDSGHFYDGDKYPECPYCNTALMRDGGSGIVVPAGGDAPAPAPGVPQAPAAPAGPVTGWLVVMNGPRAGTDYRLGEGRSFFGLEKGQPCPLSPDAPLSVRMLAVAYDPATGGFTALPGEGQTLAYLNGKAILTPLPLKDGDELGMGSARLRFVAFCGSFRWPKIVKGHGPDMKKFGREGDKKPAPEEKESTPEK